MLKFEAQNQEVEIPKRTISAESVLSYVVIGCFIVAVLGILGAGGSTGNSGVSLLASSVAFGVIAYIYCHKR